MHLQTKTKKNFLPKRSNDRWDITDTNQYMLHKIRSVMGIKDHEYELCNESESETNNSSCNGGI